MHFVKKREFLKSFVLKKTRVTLTYNLEKVLSVFKICLNCKNFSSYLFCIHVFYPSLFISIYHRLECLNFWLPFSAKIKLIYKVNSHQLLEFVRNNWWCGINICFKGNKESMLFNQLKFYFVDFSENRAVLLLCMCCDWESYEHINITDLRRSRRIFSSLMDLCHFEVFKKNSKSWWFRL